MHKYYDYDVNTFRELKFPLYQRIILNTLDRIKLYDTLCLSESFLNMGKKINLHEAGVLLWTMRSLCCLLMEENKFISESENLSFVNNIETSGNNFYLDTIFGEYDFLQILTKNNCSDEAFGVYKNGRTFGKCHLISFRNMLSGYYESEEMVLKDHIPIDKSELLTFFARSLFKDSYYLHSVVHYDGYIYDISNNVKMKADEYKELLDYEHVSSLDQATIVQDVEEFKRYSNNDSTLKGYLTNRERVFKQLSKTK